MARSKAPVFRLAEELYKDFGKPLVDEVMSVLGRDADPEMIKKAVAQRATASTTPAPKAKRSDVVQRKSRRITKAKASAGKIPGAPIGVVTPADEARRLADGQQA